MSSSPSSQSTTPAAAPTPAPAAAPTSPAVSGAVAATKAAPHVSSTWLAAKPFLFGAIAGCTATTCIQPLDMIKVRLQLSGEGGQGVVVKSPIQMGRIIYQETGALGFYKGLSAGLLRQCTYGMARLGLFRSISDALADPVTKKTSPLKSSLAGLAAGGLGSIIGNPADLALIRMQADQTLPAAQRRNYTNVFDALAKITKQEGVLGLWKGATPTVVRAMMMNLGMLTSYDLAKASVKPYMSEGWTNFTSSMIAGFFGSAFALPVRTPCRIQKQKPGADGKLPYSGSLDCVKKTFKSEGPLAFYKGFGTFYFRIAPHTVIALNVLEWVNAYAKNHGY
jgi:solute carrier family 25 oxoglutarate transporter 11